jgi:hypothetical protein
LVLHLPRASSHTRKPCCHLTTQKQQQRLQQPPQPPRQQLLLQQVPTAQLLPLLQLLPPVTMGLPAVSVECPSAVAAAALLQMYLSSSNGEGLMG